MIKLVCPLFIFVSFDMFLNFLWFMWCKCTTYHSCKCCVCLFLISFIYSSWIYSWILHFLSNKSRIKICNQPLKTSDSPSRVKISRLIAVVLPFLTGWVSCKLHYLFFIKPSSPDPIINPHHNPIIKWTPVKNTCCADTLSFLLLSETDMAMFYRLNCTTDLQVSWTADVNLWTHCNSIWWLSDKTFNYET